MPKKCKSFASAAALMVAAALLIALPAFAEPVRPEDDALVLANVPPRTAGQDDDAKTPAGQLSLDLAVQVARTAIEQGRANSDPRAYGEAEAALSNWWNETEPPEQVRMSGETKAYVWGDRMIGIHHCPTCGCGTHWETLGEDFGKMGINARLLDDFDESQVEVRKFDNAD